MERNKKNESSVTENEMRSKFFLLDLLKIKIKKIYIEKVTFYKISKKKI